MFDGKTILVTGATGSFGKKFIKKLLESHDPRKLIIFSRDELKQYEMQNDHFFSKNKGKLRYFLGDIRDADRLDRAMRGGVEYVVHAAALKHVPALEYNPFEAVKTNVIGSQNVINASIDNCVDRVIALSTDKAAAPVNLYGATKLTSDKLFVAANNIRGKFVTKFSVVRYGNVMGSRGSAIPLFFSQASTNVLPITDARMTRFNITLSEGIAFVIDCFGMMRGGEIFVPKLPSYRIVDVAKAICPDCTQKIVGIRPGEKLHEEMITETDSLNTIEHEKFYVLLPSTSAELNVESLRSEYLARGGKPCEEGFRYSSGENTDFLSMEEISKLIAENMIGQGCD
jgi:UDP-N-acetylglucosamine 4,6-dehydratase/5-epimerase